MFFVSFVPKKCKQPHSLVNDASKSFDPQRKCKTGWTSSHFVWQGDWPVSGKVGINFFYFALLCLLLVAGVRLQGWNRTNTWFRPEKEMCRRWLSRCFENAFVGVSESLSKGKEKKWITNRSNIRHFAPPSCLRKQAESKAQPLFLASQTSRREEEKVFAKPQLPHVLCDLPQKQSN